MTLSIPVEGSLQNTFSLRLKCEKMVIFLECTAEESIQRIISKLSDILQQPQDHIKIIHKDHIMTLVSNNVTCSDLGLKHDDILHFILKQSR